MAETGFPEYLWAGKYWLNWGDAVREAGYEPRGLNQRRHSDDELIEHLALLTRKLGHFPTTPQIRMEHRQNSDFPADRVIQRRLGRRPTVLLRLREFIERRTEYADLAALLPKPAEPRSTSVAAAPLDELEVAEDNADDDTQPVPGHVYLVRSGKFHKIGRSNNHGRRTYEIGLQLPEKLEVVHTIETDDAVGIERYWHERFKARRRNGEWFQLTKTDVAAFKRRRSFM